MEAYGLIAALVIALGSVGAITHRVSRRRGAVSGGVGLEAGVLRQERERLAQDLHDDLGSRLAEIRLLSAVTSQPGVSSEQARRNLARIGEQAGSLLQALDEIVWAVNPANDSVSGLAHYVCLHAQQFLASAGIRCRMDVAANLPELVLGAEQRQGLFLAFKESLHNVVRHAGAREVRLSIAAVAGGLRIRVADDGRGFDQGRRGRAGADGLNNMRARLAELGGCCRVSSVPGRGTTVEFQLPLAGLVEADHEQGVEQSQAVPLGSSTP